MAASIPQSSLLSISIAKFKPFTSSLSPKTPNLSLPLISSPLSSLSTPSKLTLKSKKPLNWKTNAVASPENSGSVYVTGDGTSTVISSLLFTAFIVLSVLTVGVVYLAVTDFVTKREKDKYEKEETAKKKKKKGGRVRARAGPKGFGQKIDQDFDFDE